jgi:hypothetical protein
MIDEGEKWARILKGLPESRHKGDFCYSTEMFHLRPEVITTKASIRNDRRDPDPCGVWAFLFWCRNAASSYCKAFDGGALAGVR